jgi:hypothetical protein
MYHSAVAGATRDMIVKIQCDLSRVCEIEDHINEWYDHHTYKSTFVKQVDLPSDIDFTIIQKYFKVVNYESTWSDGFTFRLHLMA